MAESKKMVSRNVGIVLGIICILLIVGVLEIWFSYSQLNSQISQLNTKTSGQNSTISSLNSTLSNVDSQISQMNSQISQLSSTVSNLQSQSELYIHSQLLQNGLTNIAANTTISGWILSWTPTTAIRILRIQVWMGNPANVTWEGDTYVTVGEPSNLTDSSSYNDTIQLLVHYQFDSHAQSPTPTQIMFDLTPGFLVYGQTINVWRLFNNIENYTVPAGNVQVIIYYENL